MSPPDATYWAEQALELGYEALTSPADPPDDSVNVVDGLFAVAKAIDNLADAVAEKKPVPSVDTH